MSSQIFCNMLLHGFLEVRRVNLVIMDECHHTIKDSPMRQVRHSRCDVFSALDGFREGEMVFR